MKYPDEFDTSTFPAGKQIAVSRIIGIVTMIVFLLIIFACVLLLWTQKSAHVHPFLVSINNITGQWEVVGHQHTDVKEITTTRALQESTIGKFLRYRFWITENQTLNAGIWRTCNRKIDCNPENKKGVPDDICKKLNLDSETCAKIDLSTEACALYCLSGDNVHRIFTSNIMPKYTERATIGEVWTPDMSSVQILPVDQVTENGGTWQIRMTIKSSIHGSMRILAYASISRNLTMYPKTLGYYVVDFNAYRIK